LAEPGEIPFDIRHKDGDPQAAEMLRQDSEGDGFSRAGGAGNQAMAVGHAGQDADVMLAFGDAEEILGVGHFNTSWVGASSLAGGEVLRGSGPTGWLATSVFLDPCPSRESNQVFTWRWQDFFPGSRGSWGIILQVCWTRAPSIAVAG